IGKRVAVSPSIYPDDPESKHYDPRVFLNEPPPGHHVGAGKAAEAGHVRGEDHGGLSRRRGEVTTPPDEDVLAFLRRILDEARAKRHDLVTHYTVDDLRVALGFEKPKSDDGPRTARASTPEPPRGPTESSGPRDSGPTTRP